MPPHANQYRRPGHELNQEKLHGPRKRERNMRLATCTPIHVKGSLVRYAHKIFRKPRIGIVKRAEPCKCDTPPASRTPWHKRITPLKEWRPLYPIVTGDSPPYPIIANYKLTQRNYSEGCPSSSERTCDVEC